MKKPVPSVANLNVPTYATIEAAVEQVLVFERNLGAQQNAKFSYAIDKVPDGWRVAIFGGHPFVAFLAP